jgi:type IV pilus assembly protein PilC
LLLSLVYILVVQPNSQGKRRIDGWKISFPIIGKLYKKVYLSRIADNMDTMLSSSIPVLRALEITGDVVDNQLYKDVMTQGSK